MPLSLIQFTFLEILVSPCLCVRYILTHTHKLTHVTTTSHPRWVNFLFFTRDSDFLCEVTAAVGGDLCVCVVAGRCELCGAVGSLVCSQPAVWRLCGSAGVCEHAPAAADHPPPTTCCNSEKRSCYRHVALPRPPTAGHQGCENTPVVEKRG